MDARIRLVGARRGPKGSDAIAACKKESVRNRRQRDRRASCRMISLENSLGAHLRFLAARNPKKNQALAPRESETRNGRCVISVHDTRRNEAPALRTSPLGDGIDLQRTGPGVCLPGV